jgi:hypothetical protein
VLNKLIPTAAVGSNSELGAITEYLRQRGARYLESNHLIPDVTLFGAQERNQSRIYWFELKALGRYRLLRVKIPLSRNGSARSQSDFLLSPRPRRFPPTDLETKFELEYAALSAIHNHFCGLDDPRFGAVRILDSLPDIRANVMEEIREPSLRELFARENFVQGLWNPANDAAFRNAGAWLRAYHSLAKEADAYYSKRAEFLEWLKVLTDYLGAKLGDRQFFESVLSRVTASALADLPELLPLGLRHGDYAMRNILVGHEGRVTGLDTLARWRTAIYEDIGYFLANLKLTWPQVISQGLAYKQDLIQRYERAFLNGYFASDQLPIRAIRLYEIQAVLDKWSGSVAFLEREHELKRNPLKPIQAGLENRYFKKTVNALLQLLN